MRHLFVTNDFPPKLGGIESYLTSLAKGFDPSDIAVVAPAREGWEDVDAELPYEVYRVRGTFLRAVAGFGKLELGDPRTIEKLAPFLA